jgi:hypothetical protein
VQSTPPETRLQATREPVRIEGPSVLEFFGDLTADAGPRVARALEGLPRVEAPRSPRKKAGIIAMIAAAVVLVLLVAGMIMAFATVIAAWAAAVAFGLFVVRGVRALFRRRART